MVSKKIFQRHNLEAECCRMRKNVVAHVGREGGSKAERKGWENARIQANAWCI